MITVANYGNYHTTTPTPEWMRAERYEYCETMLIQHKQNLKENLAKLFNRKHK